MTSITRGKGSPVGSDNEPKEALVTNFLSFLEKDIAEHPDRLTILNEAFFANSIDLTKKVDISDIADPLPEDAHFGASFSEHPAA